MKPKSAYGVGKIYTAIVKKVKDDRVLFDIKQLWFTADGQEEVTKKQFSLSDKKTSIHLSFSKKKILLM